MERLPGPKDKSAGHKPLHPGRLFLPGGESGPRPRRPHRLVSGPQRLVQGQPGREASTPGSPDGRRSPGPGRGAVGLRLALGRYGHPRSDLSGSPERLSGCLPGPVPASAHVLDASLEAGLNRAFSYNHTSLANYYSLQGQDQAPEDLL
ncbi:hypothetical protein DFAR_1620003 [Desulfarculales bacterium]